MTENTCKGVKIRVNQIGYLSTNKTEGEFIKYHSNIFFDKLDTYLKNGWVDKGDYIESLNGQTAGALSKELFKKTQICYVMGHLRLNENSKSFEFQSVGTKFLDTIEDKQCREDFYEVYFLANKQMINL